MSATDDMQIFLTYSDIALASSLIIIVILLSWRLRLQLTKTLLMAAVRTVVQLSFIGLILAWIFAREQWYEVLVILTIMTLIAGSAAKNRVKRHYKGLFTDTLLAVSASGILVTAIAIVMILQVQPWYTPQFVIPILGLILGNSLTAISLTTNQLINAFHEQQGRIEMMLSLSARPFEAVHDPIRSAIINGMTPTLNSMLVVGIVSLPGMMTGQILAGADPTQAVRYQIVTMFLICVSSMLGCTISALLIYRRFFNKHKQLILP
ncbi:MULTISPECIES: ABC transporter permease [Psychrobacter]|uniref:YbbM seven transmembrane helix protein n=1 Tax=Psychrobacter alimentarius TaxID=261164 RepID=A0ABN4N312_9GAMM|nr:MULTISPECIES: iron export ABC transporter permease subunit FetB [Psychrobacter]AMT96766.1 YbbM seven transmembrane helix protein [Psychrobacter alimentarius]QCB30866.1 iron export ABC transporter permease subunit FetB [Psychrobacter sp. PAMC27889]